MSDLQKSVVDLLSTEVSEDSENNDDLEETNSRSLREVSNCLNAVLDNLPEYQRETHSQVEILPGLLSYLRYYNKEKKDETITEDMIYEAWYMKFADSEDSPQCNKLFADLFQNLQIRTSSEVRY